jgi:hypothetical protein
MSGSGRKTRLQELKCKEEEAFGRLHGLVHGHGGADDATGNRPTSRRHMFTRTHHVRYGTVDILILGGLEGIRLRCRR